MRRSDDEPEQRAESDDSCPSNHLMDLALRAIAATRFGEDFGKAHSNRQTLAAIRVWSYDGRASVLAPTCWTLHTNHFMEVVMQRLQYRLLMPAVALLAAGLVGACGGDTGPKGPPNVSGSWNFNDAVSNSGLGLSCVSSATVNVVQTGSNFTGTVVNGTQTCTAGGQSSSGDLTGGTVDGGQISGSSISFTTEGCQYSGTVTGSPANRMSGSENCVFAYNGTNYTLTGTWQASK